MRRRDRDRDRRGGVLVEFALVAFAVWLVLAGVLELGRAFSAQQILQHAARTIARELSQVELAHDASFDEALRRVVDSRFLVIDSGLLARCGIPDFGAEGHSTGLERLFAETLPIGNRLLRPLMIRDREGNLELLRYPGALLVRTDGGVSATSGCEAGSIYTVGIPQLDDAAGSVQWRPVVEESPGPNAGPAQREGFELARGAWAGIRLNYPFQSAALLAARQDGGVDPETGLATRALVDADASYTDQGLEQLGASGRFEVFVKGSKAGDARFRIELTADQLREGGPVLETESTQVYAEDPAVSRRVSPPEAYRPSIRERR